MRCVKANLRSVKYTYMNICISCIYVVNCYSEVKINNRSKCITFNKNNSDMQHGLALILTYLICCTVSSDTLVPYNFSNPQTNISDTAEGNYLH